MDIIGHQKIVKYFGKILKDGRIAQAYLFCGPRHVGKFTLAKNFCEKLTGGSDAKINPDLNIVSPQEQEIKGIVKKKNIQIEEIRDLAKKMNLSSYFGRYKTAIIDDSELMTVAAQNAMLKTLEEPPEKSVFILVCHDEKKILPTVKSRCMAKKFNLVGEREMASCASGENRNEIVFWSFGRPGLAIMFSNDSEMLQKNKKFRDDLENIFRKNTSEKFSLAEILAKDTPLMLETLDVWSALLRRKIIFGDILPAISKKRALAGANLIEKCAALVKNTNVNSKLVMENLLLNL